MLNNSTTSYSSTTSDVTRLILILYSIVALAAGAAGNLFMLRSTLHRSLRSDRLGVVLARNLSLADGLYTFLFILPVLLNHMSRAWVFGEELCTVAASAQ